ncbi:MAG: hypothetical protein ABR599_06760 [Gemmatimonadota bacterium]
MSPGPCGNPRIVQKAIQESSTKNGVRQCSGSTAWTTKPTKMSGRRRVSP